MPGLTQLGSQKAGSELAWATLILKQLFPIQRLDPRQVTEKGCIPATKSLRYPADEQ